MFIANTVTTIRDTKEHQIKDGMIEKLDEMLTEFNVPHFFCNPINSVDGLAVNPDDYLSVMYEDKDRLTFDLVYALWLRTCRIATDEEITRGLRRMVERIG